MIAQPAAMTPRERAAARAAARAAWEAEHGPLNARCWVYWHTSGRAPVRCTVRPDHHDGPHDYAAAPAERTAA